MLTLATAASVPGRGMVRSQLASGKRKVCGVRQPLELAKSVKLAPWEISMHCPRHTVRGFCGSGGIKCYGALISTTLRHTRPSGEERYGSHDAETYGGSCQVSARHRRFANILSTSYQRRMRPQPGTKLRYDGKTRTRSTNSVASTSANSTSRTN